MRDKRIDLLLQLRHPFHLNVQLLVHVVEMGHHHIEHICLYGAAPSAPLVLDDPVSRSCRVGRSGRSAPLGLAVRAALAVQDGVRGHSVVRTAVVAQGVVSPRRLRAKLCPTFSKNLGMFENRFRETSHTGIVLERHPDG